VASFKPPGIPDLSGDPARDVKTLQIAYAQLTEQLTFVLQNLDGRNFTKAFMEQIGGTPNGDSITGD